ncbi:MULTISPECIES: BTAD domain-containing putative transcriptional regulator [unclassified Nonomuraea]|uniref:AfsR/SARP family transcriptional regulator n=1 Tax=unclassified Nonomuraea TaxID=2593643 RepID=UPI0033D42C75
MSDDIYIRLLGAVHAERGSLPLDPGPARQRATLAILASAAARPVSMRRLVDGVWGDEPPRNAEQSVYTYVAGLRRAFEPDRGRRAPSRLLSGTGAGYVLHVGPAQVDSLCFATRLDEARACRGDGDDRRAVRLLDEALALWRGPALSGLTGPFAERERSRLELLRLTALEQRSESLLHLGRHHEITEDLRDLTARHPLRERTRELLMLALYQSGRQAEALEVYEEGRLLLREELGLMPGEGLRTCHDLVLRGGPAPWRGAGVPHQLPRHLAGFVGRSCELGELERRLSPGGGRPPTPLVIVSGPPGVGKSTLAAQVAHLVQDRFPDGQLFVNCRGATPELPALTALDVLGRFLRGLGVAADAVPADPDEAAAMWRSLLHGRKVLVLLDDAADLAQIRPLLSTPFGTALLVTSRESMPWGEDSYQLELGRMSPAESAAMLAGLAGEERVRAGAGDTAELVRLCEGLPLALRIAGARLASRPDWSIAAMAGRLGDERRRLHELVAGDLAVRSSLAASFTALERSPRPLDRVAARTLSLLGLLHVPEITAEAAAALLDADPADADLALERLTDAHLLDRPRTGHYQLHDLVRLFAGELRPRDAKKPVLRALAYYAASTRLASGVIDPHRVQRGTAPGTAAHVVTGREEATAWLLEEEGVLTAAARQALAAEDDDVAAMGVALTLALEWPYQRSYRTMEMTELSSMALKVCERLGDVENTMHAQGLLANALRMRGRIEEAVEHLRAELAIARRLGDTFSEQRALGNLANAYFNGDQYEQAIVFAEQQLAIADLIGARVGARYAMLIIGEAHQALGRAQEARKILALALTEAEQAGDKTHQAQLRAVLGRVHLDLGEPEHALPHYLIALELIERAGYRVGRLRDLVGLSRTYRAMGKLDLALAHVTEAVAGADGLAEWETEAREEQAAVHEARARLA